MASKPTTVYAFKSHLMASTFFPDVHSILGGRVSWRILCFGGDLVLFWGGMQVQQASFKSLFCFIFFWGGVANFGGSPPKKNSLQETLRGECLAT